MMTRDEGAIDRRALLAPAALSFVTGVALLRSSLVDNDVYDRKHKELFARIKVRETMLRRRGRYEGVSVCVMLRCSSVSVYRKGPRVLEVGIGPAANLDYYAKGTQVRTPTPTLRCRLGYAIQHSLGCSQAG
jgi:hypothetical protein